MQVFDDISAELQETVAGIVNTSRCLTANTERDLSYAREKLEKHVKHLCDTQARLDAKSRDVTQHEATPAYGATVGSLERYESVTEAPRRAEYWETELATAVGTVIAYVLLFTYTLRYMYINVPRSACTQKPYELHRILLFNHPENPHRQLWWTLPHYAEMGHSTSSF